MLASGSVEVVWTWWPPVRVLTARNCRYPDRKICPNDGVHLTVRWELVWVEDMPDTMAPGTLYVSTKHRLTEHLCACGCGSEVSLPLSPTDWAIEYDGETVSVWPSIGNWRIPCRSHYVVRKSRTIWCRAWTAKEIRSERSRALRERERSLGKRTRWSRWWRRFAGLAG